MPRCQGLPEGACPDRKNDNTVKLGEGDLMLCPSCDSTRFRRFCESKQSTAGTSANVKKDARPGRVKSTKDSANVKSVSESCDASVLSAGDDKTNDGARLKSGTSGTGTSKFSDSDVETSRSGAAAAAVTDETTQPHPPERRNAVRNQAKQHTVFNELLMYAGCQRDKSNAVSLQSVISSFYTSTEISSAKKQLVNSFESYLMNCEFVTERRNSAQRSAADAETEDILELMNFLDSAGVLQNVTFVAVNYSRLPKYDPEELNICAVVDRQVSIENTVVSLSTKVDSLVHNCEPVPNASKVIDAVQSMSNKCLSSVKSLQDHVEQLFSRFATPVISSSGQSTTKSDQDRSCNVVMSGIPESRDKQVWRSQVAKVLNVAAGRELVVSDAFRLGQYRSDRCRPVLVKLTTVWDKRVVLSGARKLADVSEFRRVFVNADEPLDIRRHKIYNRLKAIAVASNKAVCENDGVLVVDGVPKFSMASGHIRDGGNNMSGLSSVTNDG